MMYQRKRMLRALFREVGGWDPPPQTVQRALAILRHWDSRDEEYLRHLDYLHLKQFCRCGAFHPPFGRTGTDPPTRPVFAGFGGREISFGVIDEMTDLPGVTG